MADSSFQRLADYRGVKIDKLIRMQIKCHMHSSWYIHLNSVIELAINSERYLKIIYLWVFFERRHDMSGEHLFHDTLVRDRYYKLCLFEDSDICPVINVWGCNLPVNIFFAGI